MQTQQDHVEAYRFLVGRMSSALVVGNPSTVAVPAARTWTGLRVGVVVTVLIAVGFLVFGLIVHTSHKSAAPTSLTSVTYQPITKG